VTTGSTPNRPAAQRVVITGIGVLSPLGNTVAGMWEAVCAGRSGTGPVTRFDASGFPTRIAAEVHDFDPARWLSPKVIRRTGRGTQYAMAAATEALTDAGWLPAIGAMSDCATVIGSGYGSAPGIEEAYRIFHTEGWRKNGFLTVPMCMPNAASSQVAMDFGFQGPSWTLSAACASGAAAIGESVRLIRAGVVRRAISGGFDAILLEGIFSIWCLLGVMSKRNEDPAGACAPFSADRDGLVMGEGACLMTLERLDDALERGAHIYAEVAGVGSNSDAESITAPTLAGQVAAMRLGLADAGLRPEEVGYVNAHGTATRLNDTTETQAIKEAFGDHCRHLAVSSTKSMMGHTMGASSALECAVTALALRDQLFPPTINLRVPDPACDLDYVPLRARPGTFDAALTNSFAFGGANVILALRRAVG
jgi:3-oxoacyl-[acyl-carrier-protein] synthase II